MELNSPGPSQRILIPMIRSPLRLPKLVMFTRQNFSNLLFESRDSQLRKSRKGCGQYSCCELLLPSSTSAIMDGMDRCDIMHSQLWQWNDFAASWMSVQYRLTRGYMVSENEITKIVVGNSNYRNQRICCNKNIFDNTVCYSMYSDRTYSDTNVQNNHIVHLQWYYQNEILSSLLPHDTTTTAEYTRMGFQCINDCRKFHQWWVIMFVHFISIHNLLN